jgi:ketosteroid isomerase-like protein
MAALLMIATMMAAADPTACAAPTEAELVKTFDDWSRAYAGHDLKATMGIFDHNVIMQFQGAPDANRTELQKSYEAEFAKGDAGRWSMKIEAVLMSGVVADVFSTWTLQRGGKVEQTNRSVDVLRRGLDCQWRIVRSLNYPAIPAKP